MKFRLYARGDLPYNFGVKQPLLSSPESKTVAASSRMFLYFTAAVTGAAVMIVEILGARMLSPFIGMSHFVWIAQIAVTLVALSFGYYLGGRAADRNQNPGTLYGAILAAAAYLIVAALTIEPIAYWCLDFSLPVGSLLASLILFFVPLSLLAMTAPFLVRVVTSSVSRVGGNVGRLTAIGTLGSFLGTLLIGYVMLPLLPNSISMYSTAAGLALLSGAYFVRFGRKSPAPAIAALAVLGAGVLLVVQPVERHYAWMKERFDSNSNFGRLQVFDRPDGELRLYSNDNLVQNTFDPVRKQSASTFTYLLAGLARAYTTNVNDVLCIGMGVGIVPMDFARGGATVDVVEINPAVVPVAERFFDFDAARVNLFIDDGRHYLNRCLKQYDAVVLDAFLGDSSPSHLMTREAFESIRRVLRPGGTLVINAFCHLENGRDFFAASLTKTLQAVFPGVRLHDGGGQIYFAATDRPEPEFVNKPDLAGVHPRVWDDAQGAYVTRVVPDPEHGRVLTDDYNPVEFYDAANREQVRRRLALSAKGF